MFAFLNAPLRKVPIWMVYLIGTLPIGYYFYAAAIGALGPEPIKELEKLFGLRALQVFVGVLAITPILRLTRLNLIRLRRALALIGFTYVLCHLSVWLLLDLGRFDLVLGDLQKRPYIMVGMLAFVLMIPLAITSNDWSVRTLGTAWRKLHQLTYIAVPLGAIHFIMLVKGFQITPWIYLVVIGIAIALRNQKLRSVLHLR